MITVSMTLKQRSLATDLASGMLYTSAPECTKSCYKIQIIPGFTNSEAGAPSTRIGSTNCNDRRAVARSGLLYVL